MSKDGTSAAGGGGTSAAGGGGTEVGMKHFLGVGTVCISERIEILMKFFRIFLWAPFS